MVEIVSPLQASQAMQSLADCFHLTLGQILATLIWSLTPVTQAATDALHEKSEGTELVGGEQTIAVAESVAIDMDPSPAIFFRNIG